MFSKNFTIPTTATKLIKKGPALIFAPHPDDEIFGCAGAILSHIKNKDQIKIIIITDGSKAIETDENNKAQYIELRKQESIQAARLLDYEAPQFWDLPDQGLHYSEKMILEIIDCIKTYQPQIIYSPSIWEYHPDHYTLGALCIEAVKRLDDPLLLAMYEVGAPLRPNLLLDITEHIQTKIRAMLLFKSQIELNNYDQHIEALNTIRTYTLPDTVQAAEAYFILNSSDIKENNWLNNLLEQQNYKNSGSLIEALIHQSEKQASTIASLKERLEHTRSMAQEKDLQVKELLNSRSWKLTAPFRKLKTALNYLYNLKKTSIRLINEKGGIIKGPVKLMYQIISLYKHYGLRYLLSRIRFHINLHHKPDYAQTCTINFPSISQSEISNLRNERFLKGQNARKEHLSQRKKTIKDGSKLWAGKSILFILPVTEAGGGSNVVINEALVLRNMGVDAQILNFERYKKHFACAYPDLNLPLNYVKSSTDILDIAARFDAVVATHNSAVSWLAPLAEPSRKKPVLAYYIQDFEPYFYPEGTLEYKNALESYTLIADIVLCCKTKWNSDIITAQTGKSCHILGPSFNIDLFRPLPRQEPSWPERPLRVVAMIRTSSPRRNPCLTMQILKEIKIKFKNDIEIITFGENHKEAQFKTLVRDFEHRDMGKQRPENLAHLFNEADIFVDFSSYQAMGLTGMEAMACGMAVILPEKGGVHSYAQNNKNALLVDTKDTQKCTEKLEKLIIDAKLRQKLQEQGTEDITHFFPEIPAFKLMQAVFLKQ